MTELVVDWCSYQAAKYAVEHWHYSKTMPRSKLNTFGAWEDNKFIGAVVFGVGATAEMLKPFGIGKWDGCELVRVALNDHRSPVSMVITASVKKLLRKAPGLRLIVSYADPEHKHAGIIYQAMNWIYTGMTQACDEYVVKGKRWHGRAFRASKPANLTTKQYLEFLGNYRIVKGSSKHRYLYPLDKAMRRQIEPLAQPYPKRETCGRSVNGSTTGDQPVGGGSIPTRPLLIDDMDIIKDAET